MSLDDIDLFEAIIGLVIGVLIFKFANKLAENLQYWPIIQNGRDAGNPFVYRVLGVVIIFLAIIMFILVPLAARGYITY